MVERGEHLRFALEASEPVGIEGEGVGQDLQRDVAIRASCRARDRPRPCRPRRWRDDFVRAEASASRDRHFFSAVVQLEITLIDRGGAFRHRIDQEPLTVRRRIVEREWGVGRAHPRVEERLRRGMGERTTGFHADGHYSPIGAKEEQLLPIAAPGRLRAAIDRDLPFISARQRERLHVDLPLSRFVGDIGDPVAVGCDVDLGSRSPAIWSNDARVPVSADIVPMSHPVADPSVCSTTNRPFSRPVRWNILERQEVSDRSILLGSTDGPLHQLLAGPE